MSLKTSFWIAHHNKHRSLAFRLAWQLWSLRRCTVDSNTCWVDRGSMEWEVCPALLHMTTSGNRTPDLLILSLALSTCTVIQGTILWRFLAHAPIAENRIFRFNWKCRCAYVIYITVNFCAPLFGYRRILRCACAKKHDNMAGGTSIAYNWQWTLQECIIGT